MTNRIERVVMRGLMYLPFHLWLKRLIEENYKNRALTAICKTHNIPVCTLDGKEYKDEWFWADKLCSKYGYYVDNKARRDKWIWKQLHTDA